LPAPPDELAGVHLAVHSPLWDTAALELQVVAIEERVRALGGAPVRSEIRPYLAWMWVRVPEPAALQDELSVLAAGPMEGARVAVHVEASQETDPAWIAGWVGPPRMQIWFDVTAALRAGLWPAEALDRAEVCARQAPGFEEVHACFEQVAPGHTTGSVDPEPNDLIYAPHTDWGFEDEATFGLNAEHIVLRSDQETEPGARHLRPARVFLPFPSDPILEMMRPRPERQHHPTLAVLEPGCREVRVPRGDPWRAERLAMDLRAEAGVLSAVPGQLGGERISAQVDLEEAERLGLPAELVRRSVEGPPPWSWRTPTHVVNLTLGSPGDPGLELLRPTGPPLLMQGLVARRRVGQHAERARMDGQPVQSVVVCPAVGTEPVALEALARAVAMREVRSEQAVSVGPVSAPLPWSPVPASGLAPGPEPRRKELPAAPQRLALAQTEQGCAVTLARSKRPRKATLIGVLPGTCASSWIVSGPADPDGALVLNTDTRQSWRVWPEIGRVQALQLPEGATGAWYTAGYDLVAFAESPREGIDCDIRQFQPDGSSRYLFLRTGLPEGTSCEDQLGIRSLQKPGGPEGVLLELPARAVGTSYRGPP
jgi:hypothetical protein